MKTVEIWKPIASTSEKYEVSDAGRIRNAKTGYVLKPMLTGKLRYKKPKVRVSTKPRIDVCVAATVLETFVGPRPPGAVVMHKDDNPLNNAETNLRWGTHKENVRDMILKKTRRVTKVRSIGCSLYQGPTF